MSDGKQEFHFGDARFSGAQSFGPQSIAHVSRVNTHGVAHDSTDLDELRSLLAQLVRDLDNAGQPDAESESRLAEAKALRDAVDTPEPDRQDVAHRWSRLRPVLRGLAAAGSVATITDLITELV